MKRNKPVILSLFLTLALLLGLLPSAALAADGPAREGQITSFAPLGPETAAQTVPVGTTYQDLALPDTVTANVSHVQEAVEAADSPDGGNTVTTPTVFSEELPVAWNSAPAYDGRTAGVYVFIAAVSAYPLLDGVAPPQITVTVAEETEAPPVNDAKTVTHWEFVNGENLTEGELPLPNVHADHQADFDTVVSLLPTQLSVILQDTPATVDVTDWSCPDYTQDEDGNWPLTGAYTFTAALQSDYACAQLPTVKVLLGGANTLARNTGGFIVEGDVNGSKHSYDPDLDILYIADGARLDIRNADPDTPTNTRIFVTYFSTANVTLSGVNIESNMCAFSCNDGSTVTITLAEGTHNTLKSGGVFSGLTVGSPAALTIGGSGTLEAVGTNTGVAGSSAGIGGGSGSITINGGTIHAIGGNGTGIGGGGAVTINGGTIDAIGGWGNAGIGGGGAVTINDGTIHALGNGGAGIGGNSSRSGGTITINGGTINTFGQQGGAGIGAGTGNNDGGTIRITGGTVTIDTIGFGSGIGAGSTGYTWDTVSGSVEISGPYTVVRARTRGAAPQDTYDVYIGSLTVKDGATLALQNRGAQAGSIRYQDCVIIDKDGHSTPYDGSGNPVAPGSAIELDKVRTNGDGYTWDAGSKTLTLVRNGSYTITQTDPAKTMDRLIRVADGVTANVTLKDVNILTMDQNASPLSVGKGAALFLTLEGTNMLATYATICVHVPKEARLTVMAADGGSLVAGSIFIGVGDQRETGGTISIYGGVIKTNAISGAITITGGTVVANGGLSGSAHISGGDVTATSSGYTPGISGDVTIDGGTVRASAQQNAGLHGKVAISGPSTHVQARSETGADAANTLSISGEATLELQKGGSNAAMSIGQCTVIDATGKWTGTYSPLTVTGGTAYCPDPQKASWQNDIYRSGAAVTVTADVPSGKVFQAWTASGLTLAEADKTKSPLTFTMPQEAVTLAAAFCDPAPQARHTIQASAGTGGVIVPAGEVFVAEGADQSFTMTAQSGWRIADVEVDGVSVGTMTTYTFQGVSGDHTIEVAFEKDGGTPAAAISATPAALDFGTVTVGSTPPAEKTVTITNTGHQNVTLSQPSAIGYDVGTLSKQTLAPGETAAFPVQPQAGLAVGSHNGTLTIRPDQGDAVTVSLAFTVKARDGGGGGGSSSSSSYSSRTLTDKDTGVQVTGSQIHRSAVLTVKAGALHKAGETGCDLLRTAQSTGHLLRAWDVSLSQSFRGNVAISLPVEDRLNDTLTVAHCKDGKLTLSDVKVADGFAKVEADSLSPFAVLDGTFTLAELEKLTATNPFTDVRETDWFYDAVLSVYGAGLMNGASETAFHPNDGATRAMTAAIIYRLEGAPSSPGEGGAFTDILVDAYYADAVAWCAAQDLVGGYGGGQFGPDDPITREQLVTILYRYAQHKGWDVSIGEDANILSYGDAFDVSDWAIPAFQWAYGTGIVGGTSETTLSPKAGATRAQLAAVLTRLVELDPAKP